MQVVDVRHVDGILKHAKVAAVKLHLLKHGLPGWVVCRRQQGAEQRHGSLLSRGLRVGSSAAEDEGTAWQPAEQPAACCTVGTNFEAERQLEIGSWK